MNQLITNRKMLAVFVVVIFALSVLLVALPVRADAPTVNTGYLASASLKGGVRFRALDSGTSNQFLFLGKPDLGQSGNRVQATFYGTGGQYNYLPASNHIIFTYDPLATPSLQVVISASRPQPYSLAYPLGDVGTLNYLQLTVAARAAGTTVSFTGVTLNGHPLGDFTAPAALPCTFCNWYVTGLDFTSGFTVEGDLELSTGQPSSAELNRLEIDVGALPEYTITASAGSGGSISPSGAVSVNCGDSQTFTITPDTGYHISDVLVDDSSVGAVSSYTFSAVDKDHTIAATFTQDEYTLTVTVVGSGSVAKDPLKDTYHYGDVVSLTATASPGWTF